VRTGRLPPSSEASVKCPIIVSGGLATADSPLSIRRTVVPQLAVQLRCKRLREASATVGYRHSMNIVGVNYCPSSSCRRVSNLCRRIFRSAPSIFSASASPKPLGARPCQRCWRGRHENLHSASRPRLCDSAVRSQQQVGRAAKNLSRLGYQSGDSQGAHALRIKRNLYRAPRLRRSRIC